MRQSGIKRAARSFNPPKLNITSMMDMFTIILIFLLFLHSGVWTQILRLSDFAYSNLVTSEGEVRHLDW